MKLNLVIFFSFLALCTSGQYNSPDSIIKSKNIRFKYKALVIPTVLITYGVIGLESITLQELNNNTRVEINEHIDNKFTIDDFSQYSPFLSVFVLNATGLKGKNNFKDRSLILTSAYLIMGTTVNIIKKTGNELRPDGSSNNSFPSGHTATAFMGAEFLYQEYKDVSIWYGISGYLVAAGTGFFRLYNDRHWFTDIAAGAGIGILSTKIAYWLHPLLHKTILKKKENLHGFIVPVYNGRQYGLGMSILF